MKRWWLGLCLLAGPVLAADEALRQQLERRVRLASRLITDDAAAQRIAASGQREAMAHLDEGRLHLSMAEKMLGQGDLAGAGREADEALRHLARARRLVPDQPARMAALRQRIDAKANQLEGLLQTWRNHLDAGAADDGGQVAGLSLVAQARSLAEQGRHDEALQALDSAEKQVLQGMNRLLGARTLDYTPRAATPAQAFEQAWERHRALMELLPLALHELRPRDDALALIERLRDAARTLRAQARQRLDDGDARQALSDLDNASLFLQRALTAAGLNMPVPVGGEP